VVKNKVAPPFKQAEFDVMFDEGISTAGWSWISRPRPTSSQKSGAWYSYGEQRIGQGRETPSSSSRTTHSDDRSRGPGQGISGMKPGAVPTADGDDGDAD
jgi:recombination protein RecA